MAANEKKRPVPNNATGRPQTRTRRLGALRHRALMLAMEGRYEDAGRLLVAQLQLDPTEENAALDPEERKLISIAATYLEKAGDAAGAARLFETLGNEERAALSRARPAMSDSMPEGTFSASMPAESTFAQSEAAPSVAVRPAEGLPMDAVASFPTVMSTDPPALPMSVHGGRATKPSPAPGGHPETHSPQSHAISQARGLIDAGHTSEAAQVLAGAGLEYEAAVCRLKTGNFSQALRHLTKVAPQHERYPVAARTAARLLLRLDACDDGHVGFLLPLIHRPPEDDKETDLYLRLADLFVTRGHLPAGRAALEAILTRSPSHPEALGRLEALVGSSADSTLDPQPKRSARSVRPIDVRVSTPPEASEAEPRAIEPGCVLGERFRLDFELGRGGMATVYSAHDLELDEQVALKVFSLDLVTQDRLSDAVERFRQELKLCRKLRHPNIIQVYDIGIHDGHRYFTMELLRGHSLDRYMGQPIDLEWGLDCLTQAGVALHAAHDMGIVHRDVKPENLFVTDSGLVKVMDFGIAKSAYQPGKTQVGTFAGTPEYMAPEQISDFSAVGPAADQYALGCVAYEMFTGSVPFAHAEMMPLLMMHIERQPQPLRQVNPTLPEQLDAVVLKMMAKHPSDRFESLQQVVDALARLRE